jgi:hypothetical protein
LLRFAAATHEQQRNKHRAHKRQALHCFVIAPKIEMSSVHIVYTG